MKVMVIYVFILCDGRKPFKTNICLYFCKMLFILFLHVNNTVI